MYSLALDVKRVNLLTQIEGDFLCSKQFKSCISYSVFQNMGAVGQTVNRGSLSLPLIPSSTLDKKEIQDESRQS